MPVNKTPKPIRPKGATGPNTKVGGVAPTQAQTPGAAKRSAIQQAKPLAKSVKKSVVKQAKPPTPGVGRSLR